MLSRHIDGYVQLHRSMGLKFRTQGLLLRNFTAFAEGQGDRFIRRSRAIEWAGQAPSPEQRHNRLATLRRCALSLHAEDNRHEVPPADVFGSRSFKRRAPHIYSAQQIDGLLEAARALAPANSIRPLTYATLLGLLAATGLRVSEALALTLDDLTQDGLVIRATKFKKSRLVPLHPSTLEALSCYLRARAKVAGANRTLFISRTGCGVKYPTVITVFLNLARQVGLRAAPGTLGPRLHDLRHTFAIRSLERCAADRQSVARHIVGLSTYLGHAHVSDTYWYLQATPTLLQQIADAGEARHREGCP